MRGITGHASVTGCASPTAPSPNALILKGRFMPQAPGPLMGEANDMYAVG